MKPEDALDLRVDELAHKVERLSAWLDARIKWLEEHSKSCVCVFVDGKPVEECGYHMELRREINRLSRAASTGDSDGTR